MANTTRAVTLQGTPTELGEQVATSLLSQPLEFANAQLSPAELDAFCCSLLSATGALIARQIGRERFILLATALANVAEAEFAQHKGALQ